MAEARARSCSATELGRGVAVAASLAGMLACGEPESRKIRLAAGAASEGAASGESRVVRRPSVVQQRAIAVLHFDDDTDRQGLEWLRRGLTDMFDAELSQGSSVSVFTPNRLDALLAPADRSAADIIDDSAAARLVRGARIETALMGRYYHEGETLVIAAELRDIATREALWSEEVRVASLESIFPRVSELSARLREALSGELPTPQVGDFSIGVMTGSVAAFRHYSRGLASLERVLTADADREFQSAIAADPTFAAAYLRYSETRGDLGDLDGMLDALAQARRHVHKLSPSGELLLGLREALLAGDALKIREVRESLWRSASCDIDVRMEVAGLLRELGEVDRAVEEYELILDQDPSRKLAYDQLGGLYADRGDYHTALKLLDRYRRLAVDEPNAHEAIGEVLLRAGRLEDAVKHFERALARAPGFFSAARHLSEVHSEMDDLDLALRYSDRWIEAAPTAPHEASAYLARASLNWRFGRIAEAEAALAAAAALDRGLVEVPLLRAAMHRELGDDARAGQIEDECLVRARELVASTQIDDWRLAGLINRGLENELDAGALLDLVARGEPRVRVGSMRNLLHFYRRVLAVRAGRPVTADWAADAERLALLVTGRKFPRSLVWKYVVETVEREPPPSTAEHPLATAVVAAARRSERSDLEVLGRLLAVQHAARRDGERALVAGYRRLGVPVEGLWRIIGAFENRAGFRHRFPPEREIDLGARYGAAGEVAWRPAADGVRDGFVDLGASSGRRAWTVGYAAIVIRSPRRRAVQLRLGADEACKLWLNDDLVWKSYRSEDAWIDQDVIQVALRRGDNRVLVKVANSHGDSGFYLRVTDESGQGVPGISFSPVDRAERPRSRRR